MLAEARGIDTGATRIAVEDENARLFSFRNSQDDLAGTTRTGGNALFSVLRARQNCCIGQMRKFS